jgi:hypothetical protein
MARTRLLVDIEANSAKLVSEVEKSRKAIQGMSADLKLIKFDSIINLGERAFHAGQQMYSFAKSIASAANDIQRNARTLNMATDEYQKWTYAAKMADVSSEDFMNGMKFITKSISEASQGTGDAAKAFDLLGIKIKDSSGKTKDQQIILMETIDALNRFEDGANRDALMLAIFGRAWMTLKPLINEGSDAIKQSMEELTKMGSVLGNVVLQKGSEAENMFKRLETQVNSFKIGLAPMASAFAAALTDMAQMARDFKEKTKGWFTGISPQAWGGVAVSNYPVESEKRFGGWGASAISGIGMKKKPGAPGLPNEAEVKRAMEEERRLLESGVKGWIEYIDAVQALDVKLYAALADNNKAYWDGVEKEQLEAIKRQEAVDETMIKIQGAVFGGEGNMYDYGNLMSLKAYEDGLKKSAKATFDFGSIFESTFSSMTSGLTTLVNSSASFGERMKAIFSDMANDIIQSLTKAMINMAIFGNMQGSTKGGTGWGTKGQSGYGGIISLVGGIIGSFQTGTNYVPATGLYQLHQGEAVIPSGQNESGGNTYITNIITAADAKSFDDMVKRNPESILSISQRSARAGGTFRSILRTS